MYQNVLDTEENDNLATFHPLMKPHFTFMASGHAQK
jgi:hypothetical protein